MGIVPKESNVKLLNVKLPCNKITVFVLNNLKFIVASFYCDTLNTNMYSVRVL